MVHVYQKLLRLYPGDFRRRYGSEMALDFEDALGAARAEGWRAVGAFARGAAADLAVSLLREWMRSGRLAIAAAAVLTLLVTELQPLQRIFDTVALTSPQWGICLLAAVVFLALTELGKLVDRRRD